MVSIVKFINIFWVLGGGKKIQTISKPLDVDLRTGMHSGIDHLVCKTMHFRVNNSMPD